MSRVVRRLTKCDAPVRTTATQTFEPWPVIPGTDIPSQWEPWGNPAFEGTGYPSAGYGQSRRTLVKLAQPKQSVPQLTNKGWEGKQPVLHRVNPRGTLNPQSDTYARGVVGVLRGIGSLGCNCKPVDGRMMHGLRGLSSNLGQSGAMWTVQAIADGIARNALPEAFLQQLVDKLVADEKANVEAFNAIQVLKRVDASNPQIATLTKLQQDAWGQTNTAKFYALMLPEMQRRLGFTTKQPLVSPPDYAFIKNKDSEGVFNKVAAFLREKVTGDVLKGLMSAGYVRDSSLKGLGFVQFAIPLALALVVAAGIIAYLNTHNSSAVREQTVAQLTALRANGRMSQADFEQALNAVKNAGGTGTDNFDFGTIAKVGGALVGGLVLIQILPIIRDAFRR